MPVGNPRLTRALPWKGECIMDISTIAWMCVGIAVLGFAPLWWR